MSALAQKVVRVATVKATGERYILESFFGNRALLHGNVIAFDGAQSWHDGKPFWIDAAAVTVEEMPKGAKLLRELTQQAAKAKGAMVKVTKRGAALVLPPVTFKLKAQAPLADRPTRLAWIDRQRVMASFLKVE